MNFNGIYKCLFLLRLSKKRVGYILKYDLKRIIKYKCQSKALVESNTYTDQ